MLVYGDAVEVADPRQRLAGLRERLDEVARLPRDVRVEIGAIAVRP